LLRVLAEAEARAATPREQQIKLETLRPQRLPDFLKQLLGLEWQVFNKPFPYSMPVEYPQRTVQGKDHEVSRHTHRSSEQEDTSPSKIGRVGDNKR